MSDFPSPELLAPARDGSGPSGPRTSTEIVVYERIHRAAPRSIRHVRHGLDAALAELGVRAARRSDIALAVTEAVTNAVLHAYADTEPGPVHVEAGLTGARLRIAVTDCGRGMVPRADSPGLGVGLALIRELSDELTVGSAVCGTGTRVTMDFGDVAITGYDPAAQWMSDGGHRVMRRCLLLVSTAVALQAETRALLAEATQALAARRRRRERRASEATGAAPTPPPARAARARWT
jgi:serine/threonine-protein kinase RsbW/stage II sporulation protein AB (anti-sigma F factor)